MKPLTILLTTYAPAGGIGEATAAAAKYCMHQWSRRMRYPGELALHVSDDGSSLEGYATSAETPPGSWWKRGPVTFSRQERHGIGASINAGLRQAFKRSPVAALLMDDWGLYWPFDFAPWVNLLEREDIGLVRLGPPHPNIVGKVELHEEAWFLRLQTDGVFVSLRPWMVHERFMLAYGKFPEDNSVGECERIFNERVRALNGPDVVVALPTAWEWVYAVPGHQPRPSLAGIDPAEPQSFATYRCSNGHVFDWRTHDGVLQTCQWVMDPKLEYHASLCGAPVEVT